ncbi:uncharacterized protein DS421_17g582430 [Arachis hypogaea]|nr:uncharacterized protein DS421_17g582430 [Arachis hypogaea]
MGLLKLEICLGYGCFVCQFLRHTVRIQKDRNISLGWFKHCFVLRKDLGIDATGVNSSFTHTQSRGERLRELRGGERATPHRRPAAVHPAITGVSLLSPWRLNAFEFPAATLEAVCHQERQEKERRTNSRGRERRLRRAAVEPVTHVATVGSRTTKRKGRTTLGGNCELQAADREEALPLSPCWSRRCQRRAPPLALPLKGARRHSSIIIELEGRRH